MMEEWDISQLVDHCALKIIMGIYNTNKILKIPITRHLSVIDGDDSNENYVASDATDPGTSLLIIAAFICLISLIGLPLYVKFGKWLSARYKYCGNTSSSDSNNIHNGDEDDNITYQVEQQGDDTPDLSFMKRCRKVLRSSVQFVLNTRKRGAHTAENVDGRREALERGIAREARESLYRQQQHTIVSPIDLTLGESVETTLDGCQINFDTYPQSHETKDSKGTEVVVLDSQNNDGTNISTESDIEKGSGQLPVPTVSIDGNNSQPSSYIHKKLLFMRTIVKYDHETKRILHLAIPFTFSAIADTTSDLSEYNYVVGISYFVFLILDDIN